LNKKLNREDLLAWDSEILKVVNYQGLGSICIGSRSVQSPNMIATNMVVRWVGFLLNSKNACNKK